MCIFMKFGTPEAIGDPGVGQHSQNGKPERDDILRGEGRVAINYSRIDPRVHNIIMGLPFKDRYPAAVAYLEHGIEPDPPLFFSSYYHDLI